MLKRPVGDSQLLWYVATKIGENRIADSNKVLEDLAVLGGV